MSDWELTVSITLKGDERKLEAFKSAVHQLISLAEAAGVLAEAAYGLTEVEEEGSGDG